MSRPSNDFRQRSASSPRRFRVPQKGRLAIGSLDWHACRHEELEDRRLLTVVPFASIASQVRADLLAVETTLVQSLNNFSTGDNSSLPFVGEHLGDASKAMSGFSNQIQAALASLGSPNDPSPALVQTAIFDALGPGGLNILGDRNSNGVDSGDVLVSAPGGVLNDDFSVQMRLSGTIAGPAVPLKFDTGLPGLPLSIRTDGSLAATVNFSYELAFTYDAQTQNVDLDNTKTLAGTDHQMALAVSIGLADFSATAIMGFVQGDLTALSNQPNGLSLAVELNNLGAAPQIAISGSADANLQLSGSFAGTANDFPGIDTDLHLHWSINTENPSAAAPDVWFDNVYLDLGDFISNVVGPVFEKIHLFTQPLAPVLDVLGYPLPGPTDLSRLVGGDDVTLLDLGGVAATVTGFGPLYDLIEKVLNIIDKINDFDVGDSVRLKLGGFDLDSIDLRNVASAGNPLNTTLRNLTDLSPSNLIGIAQSLASKIDELPISDEQKAFLKGFAEQLNNGFSLKFPILENPQSAIFPLLLGRDSDLFTLDAEVHQTAKGSVATGFSIFGIGIDFGGEVEIDSKFKFAYDTFGMRNLISDIAAGNTSAQTIAEDVIDGFYVASDSYFNLAGQIYAGAGAGIGIFSAIVGGFVSTGDSGDEPVSVTINDPNHDGKLRFSEFASNPLDLSGELSAELGVEVRVGFEVLGEFVGLKKRFNLAREVLVDFDPDPGDPNNPANPILASQPDANGNINLYIGALAHLREEVDDEDGNERLRIQHVETTAAGETVDITIRQKSILGIEYDVTQRIAGVKQITGIDGLGDLSIDVLPGVTSNVHFEGGTGHAELMYEGSGIAFLKAGILDSSLSGGLGENTLLGGPGNDTISLGHAGNTVSGGGGGNTIIVNAPTTQGGSVVGGDTANNLLVVSSGVYTSSIDLTIDSPGAMRLAYDDTAGTYPNLILSKFNRVSVTAQDSDTDIHIGELSSAGVETVYINVPTTGQGGREIELETSSDLGLSNISLDPFDHTYSTPDGSTVNDRAMLLTNVTTGVETYILGVAPDDVTTIHQYGGTATLGPLGNDNGTIVFDTRQRPVGQSETVFMQIPSDSDGNEISSGKNSANDFVIEAQLYPTIVFKGLASIDRIEMDVAAPTTALSKNTLLFDASTLAGLLDIDLQGSGSLNEVTISQLGLSGVIDVDGGTSTTLLNYGTGRLWDIAGNVRVHNVVLTIDDSGALLPSLMSIGSETLNRRVVPDDGLRPSLAYDGLRGTFTLHGGAGDRVGLEQTPPGIDRMQFTNPSNTQDALYVEAASSNLLLDGNWSLYLGRELLLDGTVQRTSRLAPMGISIELNFTGAAATEIILDAALDPTGAHYTIGGRSNVEIQNSTVGLTIQANGLRLVDDLKLYITGANVNIGLPAMGPVEITIDSNDRFAGINPTAPNDISIEVLIGTVSMTPLGAYDSRIEGGNPINILATMAQDTTNIGIATSTTLGVGLDDPATVFGYGGDFLFADAYYLTHIPAGFWPLVRYIQFGDGVYNPSSYLDTTYPELTGLAALPYGYYVPWMSAGFGYSQTWLDPTSNYIPPLPLSATATGLLYPVNPDPRNSKLDINASQLRGQLNVNVHQPDYTTANWYASFFYQLTWYRNDVSDVVPYWKDIDGVFPWFVVKFGETTVNLSQVGGETTAHVQGTTPLVQNENTPLHLKTGGYGSISDPRTKVTLGGGDLSNIDGAVTFNQVQLTIDGRNGTLPNILQLNGSSFAGWSTGVPGVTQTATLGVLYDTLTIIGGAADSFSILQTPIGPSKVTIQGGVAAPLAMSMAIVADREPIAASMAEEDATPGVYLVGKQLNQLLEVNGHFEFYIGRKLNSDGSVEVASSITGFANLVTNSNASQIITYNYVGQGQGKLVYDVASYIAFGPNVMVGADAAYSGKGVMVFDYGFSLTRNKLIYSPNTDLSIFSAQRVSPTIENQVTATIRYFVNPVPPTNFYEDIRIYAAYGPVFVTGRGERNTVTIMPTLSSSKDLRDTIRAAVTVTDVGLRIAPDTATTPAPATLAEVVLTPNSVTGLTGAPVYFERLTDYTPDFSSGTTPGLHIGMPKNGAASLTIVDTPVGVTTAFSTVTNVSIGPVTVQATTGPLWLGYVSLAANDAIRNEFRAASVLFGDGTLQNIRGDVYLGARGGLTYFVPGGTTLDNHADIPREVLFGGATNRAGIDWTGLAPAAFLFEYFISTQLTILGSAGSHYKLLYASDNSRLMGGVGTTIDVLENTISSIGLPDGMKIYGAQRVTLSAPENMFIAQGQPLEIFTHPDRPNEITDLIVDYTVRTSQVWFDKLANGRGELWANTPSNKLSVLDFPAETTNFTFLGFNQDWDVSPYNYQISVVDTVARSTTVNPGNRQLYVLGTTQPLAIEHDGPQTVVLGNAGNMQNLLGPITVNIHDEAATNVVVDLNNSANSLPRSVSLSNPLANQWIVSGLAPAIIEITGSRSRPALRGGAGANTLQGPDAATTWDLTSSGGGFLSGTVSFSGMTNLVGGAGNDDFYFRTGGQLAGNLDGGGGFDTAHYIAVLNGSEPIDLEAGIFPKVAGTAIRIEAVDVVLPMAVQNPGDQTSRVGLDIVPLQIVVTGGDPLKTYSAAGLPTGLSIDSTTGIISGTVSSAISVGTSFNVIVTVSDSTSSKNVAFAWTVQDVWSITNPGDQLTPEGVPISLQIQVDNPTNLPIRYDVNGLPSYLSINPQTGVISGTIYFYYQAYGQNFTFHVNVFAYGPTSTKTVSFNWTLKPGFQLYSGAMYDTAGETFDFPVVTNPYNHSIAVTSTGLPPGLSMDSSGRITGTIDDFAFRDEAYIVEMTAFDQTINYTATQTFTWYVSPAITISPPVGLVSYAGLQVESAVSIQNPLGHTFTVEATNLPPGLSIDEFGIIAGTLTANAAQNSPYLVTVTVNDVTVGRTIEESFEWTILPQISLDDLNANTPPGTPILVDVLDPMANLYPQLVTAIHYPSQPEDATSIYIVTDSLWVIENGQRTAVASIDPDYPTIGYPQKVVAVPGHGVLLLDINYHVWFVDQSGGRVIIEDPLYFDQAAGPVYVGESTYLLTYDGQTYQSQITEIDFSGDREPQVRQLPVGTFEAIEGMHSFAGGLIYHAYSSGESLRTLYWYNPETDLSIALGTGVDFNNASVAPALDGTQNLFVFVRPDWGVPYQLRVVNSAALSGANQQLEALATFASDDQVGGAYYPDQPIHVTGTKISFSVTHFSGDTGEYSTQFWTSDGTSAGTLGASSFLIGQAQVVEQIAFAGSVYFFYRFNPLDISETTTVAQLWKFDPASGELSLLQDFLGPLNAERPPNSFTIGGEFLYFSASNGLPNQYGLWRLKALDTAPSLVPSKPSNAYANPAGGFMVGDRFYFTAESVALPNQDGIYSWQIWSVGTPAVVSPPGDLDGDGTVNASDIDAIWRLIQSGNALADLNGDGSVDQSDADYLVRVILNTEYGDANLDGFVDAADLAVTRLRIGSTFGQPNWAGGDFDGDGIVDATDLATVRRNLGFARPLATPAAAPLVATSVYSKDSSGDIVLAAAHQEIEESLDHDFEELVSLLASGTTRSRLRLIRHA